MKDHYEEICAWNAAHTILDLYMEIELNERYYLEKLAIYLDTEAVSQKAMSLWRHRDRGLPQKYNHRQVMNALDAVIEHYCEDGNIPSFQKAPVLAKWGERREAISEYLKGMIGESTGPTPAEKFNEHMKGCYATLTLETVFALYTCFDALNGTTWNDIAFLRVILKIPAPELTQKISLLTHRKIAAQSLLGCLHNAEVAQWLDLLNEHNTARSKEDLWERLLEKMDGYCSNATAWHFLLDLLIDCNNGSFTNIGQAEIDLLILFKYCLTEDEQADVLAELRT